MKSPSSLVKILTCVLLVISITLCGKAQMCGWLGFGANTQKYGTSNMEIGYRHPKTNLYGAYHQVIALDRRNEMFIGARAGYYVSVDPVYDDYGLLFTAGAYRQVKEDDKTRPVRWTWGCGVKCHTGEHATIELHYIHKNIFGLSISIGGWLD